MSRSGGSALHSFAMAEPTKHHGSCHCGKVQYDVEIALDAAVACNCSMCMRKGTLLTFVPEERFELRSGEDALTHYRFHKHVIDHNFCSTCGVTSFARGLRPDGVKVVAINVRCLDGVDLGALTIKQYDGKSL